MTGGALVTGLFEAAGEGAEGVAEEAIEGSIMGPPVGASAACRDAKNPIMQTGITVTLKVSMPVRRVMGTSLAMGMRWWLKGNPNPFQGKPRPRRPPALFSAEDARWTRNEAEPQPGQWPGIPPRRRASIARSDRKPSMPVPRSSALDGNVRGCARQTRHRVDAGARLQAAATPDHGDPVAHHSDDRRADQHSC